MLYEKLQQLFVSDEQDPLTHSLSTPMSKNVKMGKYKDLMIIYICIPLDEVCKNL